MVLQLNGTSNQVEQKQMITLARWPIWLYSKWDILHQLIGEAKQVLGRQLASLSLFTRSSIFHLTTYVLTYVLLPPRILQLAIILQPTSYLLSPTYLLIIVFFLLTYSLLLTSHLPCLTRYLTYDKFNHIMNGI